VQPPLANVRGIVTLRRELATAERELRERAARAAETLSRAERAAWREARDACHAFDSIRPRVEVRLAAFRAGASERFLVEQRLGEMALRDADRADAAYTIISFAGRRERLRYLRGGAERDSVIRKTLERGGVYGERGHFFEVLR
jgi:hypothetical protein